MAYSGGKLYVGNLSYNATDADLKRLFGQFGTVKSTMPIIDRESGQSKGFAFVEMSQASEAAAAIVGLNGKELAGRHLTVRIAKPKAGPRGPVRGEKVRKRPPALGRRLRKPRPEKPDGNATH